MLRGCLDALSAAGHVLGWACETAAPGRALPIAIRSGDAVVASGFAHEYRRDVAAAGMAAGWCGFSLRLGVSPAKLRKATLAIVHPESGMVIHESGPLRFLPRQKAEITSIEALLDADPTTLASIDQLASCDTLFIAFIKSKGPDTFVRTAYAYALQRSADPTGLAIYTRALRKAALSPFEVLRTLTESDEFHSRPRALAAPPTSSFPFYTD